MMEIINLSRESDALFGQGSIRVNIPDDAKDIRPPSFPQTPPLLAAAPAVDEGGNRLWRVAWLVDGGVAVVDIARDGGGGAVLHGGSVYLTSLEGGDALARLVFSEDGNFLILSKQQTWSSTPEVRVFDLRLNLRREEMDTKNLTALR